MIVPDPQGLILAALSGFALGGAFFALLRLNTHLYAGGRAGRAALLHLARLVVTAGVFVSAALHGAGPLLALFAGFLAARFALLRRLGAPHGGPA